MQPHDIEKPVRFTQTGQIQLTNYARRGKIHTNNEENKQTILNMSFGLMWITALTMGKAVAAKWEETLNPKTTFRRLFTSKSLRCQDSCWSLPVEGSKCDKEEEQSATVCLSIVRLSLSFHQLTVLYVPEDLLELLHQTVCCHGVKCQPHVGGCLGANGRHYCW